MSSPWSIELTDGEIQALVEDGILLSASGSHSTHKPLRLTSHVHGESIRALEFLGLTRETASSIFERWETQPESAHNFHRLFEYAYGNTERLHLEPCRNVPPLEALELIGINKTTRTAICDSQHLAIFQTEPLAYWVNDTLCTNARTLATLLIRLKELATASTAKQQADVGEGGSRADFSASTMSAGRDLPGWTIVQEPARLLPGHQVLYKATIATHPNYDTFLVAGGVLNMRQLPTFPKGDFNATENAWYWTPEAQTAEQYHAYAAQRSPLAETWVIRIQVPDAYIATLHQEQLWYSHDWKRFVWSCRRGARPADWNHLRRDGLDMIVGHVCRLHAAGARPKDPRAEMDESHVLYNDRKKATQWAFMRSAVADELMKATRGKVHIEVTAPAMKLD